MHYNYTAIVENYFHDLPLFIQEHSIRVGAYARLLYDKLLHLHKQNSISEMIVPSNYDMEKLGRYHDIGKIGVTNKIWENTMPLSSEEQKIIRFHTIIGAYIIEEKLQTDDRNSTDFRTVLAQCCLYHHERWDGTGYPLGLRETEIPVFARIIGIADAFDAMISNRPYHKGICHEMALQEILAGAGKQFDPFLANIFCTMMQEQSMTG